MRRVITTAVLLATIGCLHACQRPLYNPQRATRAYPRHLHRADSVDIQVFRDGAELIIVNSTAHSYDDFDLWINQRYVSRVDSLPAGATVRLSLWEFYDEFGEVINAGGFWRTLDPTPIRLVEVQLSPDAEMFGLITMRPEEAETRRSQQ